MKISVIIPVYNIEDYIDNCIESVQNQTYRDYEIIIVDDGSTDETLEHCYKYESDSKISIITQENGGLSAARNVGLLHAKGEYITFLDGDDWLTNDALERMMANVEKYKCDVVSTAFYRDYPNKVIDYSQDEIVLLDSRNIIERMLMNSGTNHSACGKLFRRELFDMMRFPEGKYFEDYYTIYYVMDKANSICLDGHATYHYRLRGGSIQTGSANIIEKVRDFIHASDEVLSYLKKGYPDMDTVILDRRIIDLLQTSFMLKDNKKTDIYISIQKELSELYKKVKSDNHIRKYTWYMIKLHHINPNIFYIVKEIYGIKLR